VSDDPRPAELRILDGRGCLTAEAIVFAEQLAAEQRAVVERHGRSCVACAQLQTSIARATDRFRRARPRLPVPSELRQIARHAALHGMARRPRTATTTARLRSKGGRARHAQLGRPFYRSRTFWIATLTGAGTALVLALLAAIVLRVL
jgi:hypothetical protein